MLMPLMLSRAERNIRYIDLQAIYYGYTVLYSDLYLYLYIIFANTYNNI